MLTICARDTHYTEATPLKESESDSNVVGELHKRAKISCRLSDFEVF